MGHPLNRQQHCEILPDSITFRRLGLELASYDDPCMLICEEKAAKDLIHRRLVSALHLMGRDLVEMSVPDGRFSPEEFSRCCNIARESGVKTILAYGLGISLRYAYAVSTHSWGEPSSWRQYANGTDVPLHEHIPFIHVFASLEHYDNWSHIPGIFRGPGIEPNLAIQVTSAIY